MHADDASLIFEMRDVTMNGLARDEMHGDGIIVESIGEHEIIRSRIPFPRFLIEEDAAVSQTDFRLRALGEIREIFARDPFDTRIDLIVDEPVARRAVRSSHPR